jgi:hypothetical protein
MNQEILPIIEPHSLSNTIKTVSFAGFSIRCFEKIIRFQGIYVKGKI